MKVLQTLHSKPTQDGNGVKIARVHDFHRLRLDPFLMIDELKSDDEADFIGGFPPHPHRGIETFTYMKKGGFEHQDHMGNRKVISDGDVQWMSTGYGVVHSEMPVATDDGMHGFQIWINMPAKDKLRPARYQDSTQQPLPEQRNRYGATLRALAGSWQFAGERVTSPLTDLASQAAIADIHLPAGAIAQIDRADYDKVFVLVHTGVVNGLGAGTLAIVDPATPLHLESAEDSGVLVFSGHSLNETIAHYGPFVMNTQAELEQAFQDYRDGKFGTMGA